MANKEYEYIVCKVEKGIDPEWDLTTSMEGYVTLNQNEISHLAEGGVIGMYWRDAEILMGKLRDVMTKESK